LRFKGEHSARCVRLHWQRRCSQASSPTSVAVAIEGVLKGLLGWIEPSRVRWLDYV